ncbi:MAG: SpoIID/LytB domain-containing protein, partial [Actinomycetota bacterium]|nr:SpoIID/LytB domain-containing protein [Actinomycetota bacterium]
AAPAGAAPAFRRRVAEIHPDPAVVLRGGGFGHGVGMSQYGAYAMAQAGHSGADILRHYYRGVVVGATAMPSRVRVGLARDLPFSNVDALTGSVAWRTCRDGDCTTVRTQPRGTTWTVRLRSDGRYTIFSGDRRVFRGGAGKRLVAKFHGTVIEAYNPNGARQRYRWGRLEYSVNSAAAGTMFVVLDIPSMQRYLRGLGEVPSYWGLRGPAALRAQAIIARTYATSLHRAFNGNRPDCRCSLLATPANQAYTGYDKETETYGEYWVAAVRDTIRRVATYEGALIGAFYSSSHGGRSEHSEDSWAYSASLPYLRSVDDPWSRDERAGNPLGRWERPVDNDAFARFVGSGMATVRQVEVLRRTAGNTVATLRVTGLTSTGAPLVVKRSGEKNIVGLDLRRAFGFSNGRYNLPTLPSQQVRGLGFAPFTDDDGLVHELGITFVHQAGIAQGVTATRFRPRAGVTRGQLATLLYRTFALPPAQRDHFDDDDASAHEPSINAVAEAGIANGISRTRFRPNAPITRDQAATLLRVALGLSPSSTDRFGDDDASVHEASINVLARRRIASGCERDRYCPDRAVQRGEIATLLYRAVEAYR